MISYNKIANDVEMTKTTMDDDSSETNDDEEFAEEEGCYYGGSSDDDESYSYADEYEEEHHFRSNNDNNYYYSSSPTTTTARMPSETKLLVLIASVVLASSIMFGGGGAAYYYYYLQGGGYYNPNTNSSSSFLDNKRSNVIDIPQQQQEQQQQSSSSTSTSSSSGTQQQQQQQHQHLQHIQSIRKQILDVSHNLFLQQYSPVTIERSIVEESSTTTTTTTNDTTKTSSTLLHMMDLTPVYDVVRDAIRTIGMVSLYFDVFDDGALEWFVTVDMDDDDDDDNYDDDDDNYDDDDTATTYKSKHSKCWDTHGTIGCGPNEPWWIYHYVGVTTAQVLLREGHIQWTTTTTTDVDDDATNSTTVITDAATLFRQLHVEQDRRKATAGDMSYHAMHGLLWELMPRYDTFENGYPFALAEAYCGDYYGHHNVRGTQAHRTIGHECFHGIGHATFMAIAARQLQQQHYKRKDDDDDNKMLVLKPSNGFEFTHESWCAIYHVCSGASNMTTTAGSSSSSYSSYSTDVQDRCFGGVRHSVRIFARDDDRIWRFDTDETEQVDHFFALMEECDGQDDETR